MSLRQTASSSNALPRTMAAPFSFGARVRHKSTLKIVHSSCVGVMVAEAGQSISSRPLTIVSSEFVPVSATAMDGEVF
jgi:hypothetical protein